MIDPRFYEALGPATVRALSPSSQIGGDTERLIASPAPADRAGPDEICYYEPKKGSASLASAPGACVVAATAVHLVPNAHATIISDAPRSTFARITAKLARPRAFTSAERIDPSAQIEEGALICAGVVIGAGARIGAGAVIGPNAVIGPGVAIGRRTQVGANTVISFSLIGDDVVILAGAAIGEQGFGVAGDAEGLVDVPHLGRVVVQDRVTIGANTTIDRGVFDDTTIGEDSKIDNLCQIAHNVVLGRGVLIAAFGGISGSTIIEDGAILGGRVGVADHRRVGARSILAGGSAVMQDVPPGEVWGGYPARPIRKWLRETAWLSRKSGGGA